MYFHYNALEEVRQGIRSNKAIAIIDKIQSKAQKFVAEMVSALDTFGIPSKEKGHPEYSPGDIVLVHSDGANSSAQSYIGRDKVKKNAHLMPKCLISKGMSN